MYDGCWIKTQYALKAARQTLALLFSRPASSMLVGFLSPVRRDLRPIDINECDARSVPYFCSDGPRDHVIGAFFAAILGRCKTRTAKLPRSFGVPALWFHESHLLVSKGRVGEGFDDLVVFRVV